jgi:hypothetical protein
MNSLTNKESDLVEPDKQQIGPNSSREELIDYARRLKEKFLDEISQIMAQPNHSSPLSEDERYDFFYQSEYFQPIFEAVLKNEELLMYWSAYAADEAKAIFDELKERTDTLKMKIRLMEPNP